MKKTFSFFFLLYAACILNAQPNPPGGLIINHGWPIYCDSACLFDWNDVSPASYYGFQVWLSSSVIINAGGLLTSEYTVLPFTFNPNTNYYCRINVTGPGGTSQWSQLYYFNTVALPPSQPILISPADSAYLVPLTTFFDWSNVPGADMYKLQVSISPIFTNFVINMTGLYNSGYTVPSGVLAICTRYYWRVAALNAGGQGVWSAVQTFVTICPSVINQISANIPSEYKLYQNYPNPFNPNSIIRFQINDSRLVTLKIYDVIGKEVSTPVNEKLSPGKYEVTFDGSNLPSGLYYYTIRAGDFTETKKMILIK
jgi:hypothetical protein